MVDQKSIPLIWICPLCCLHIEDADEHVSVIYGTLVAEHCWSCKGLESILERGEGFVYSATYGALEGWFGK